MVIIFGPAGIGSNDGSGLKEINKLGLKCAEVEFTYGVRMTNSIAKSLGKIAKELNISLSVHAPYYINLCSEDKTKIHASMKRIVDSCEKGHYLGARYIIFHAAFYGKLDKEAVYQEVKKRVLEMQEEIKKFNVILCPETTGKSSQFGDLDELIRLANETGCGVCVDFAHLKARNNGDINYEEIVKKIRTIKELTCHFSGIEYTSKGEKRHKITEEKEIEELVKELVKHKIDARIINESPDPVKDSVKSLKIYEKLR